MGGGNFALPTITILMFTMISSLTMNIHIQSAEAQPINPCNPLSVCEKEHSDTANFSNDTSSALKTGDVKGALQVLEKAQILLEKHDINERSNSSNKLTNQGNGEMTTHTGITKDKMGACEKVLCLYVDMVVSCSSKVNSCPNASQYTLAAQPAAFANPISFQGKCCGEFCDQIVFFQQTTESYSISVTNAPPNGGKIEYGTYCKGGALLPVVPPNICTVTAIVS